MVVFQTAKLRRGVRMFRATRSTADSRQIITILTTSSVFRAPAPDKLSIAALPFTNMRGGLEQEFSADGKRLRRDHDFSVQSVAAFGAVIKGQFI